MAGAGVKILTKRIRSVGNTQKITKAMKMVAASKLQRSQGKMLAARPYSQKLTELMQQLAGKADISDPLFEVRPVKRRLFMVLASDKGLCGSYNVNVIKMAQKAVDESIAEGVETEVYAVGRKVAKHFRKQDYKVFESHEEFGGSATSDEGRMIGNNLVNAFLAGTFDEVRVVYSSFISTMTQRPVELPLLPIAQEDTAGEEETDTPGQDYIWEPSQEAMFAILLPLYLRNRVFMTLAESFTSEHAARMTSMSAATQNAGEMIEALTLQRNRERQAAITSELLDIVGGANAL